MLQCIEICIRKVLLHQILYDCRAYLTLQVTTVSSFWELSSRFISRNIHILILYTFSTLQMYHFFFNVIFIFPDPNLFP